MSFESPQIDLSELLEKIGKGEIQLPDFQREWKWPDSQIKDLLLSVSLGHPIGVLMMLEAGGKNANFASRPLAGVKNIGDQAPERLVLDGQQRLTSLYQAIESKQPVITEINNREVARRYYINIEKALHEYDDLDDKIISVPEERKNKGSRRTRALDLSTIAFECEEEMFPLSAVSNTDAKNKWMFQYINLNKEPSEQIERMNRWTIFEENVLKKFEKYKIPVILLTKDTPKEAVCTVFEKVNTAGVKLSVFELLTAILAATGFKLREDWKKRKRKLEKCNHSKIFDFGKKKNEDSIQIKFLQVIALLTTQERKKNWHGSDNLTPGVSCKRKAILRLTVDDYERWADKAVAGFKWAAEFLAKEGIFEASKLPYPSQLVPLAALYATIGYDVDNHGPKAKIRQWYWCGVLGQRYGGASETKFARDLEQVIAWINDEGKEPDTVNLATFSQAKLLDVKTLNSAVFKGIYALLLQNNCKDWQTDVVISFATFFNLEIEVHHIFPSKWCELNRVEKSDCNSIVNKTAISKTTNRIIGGNTPSDYMNILGEKTGLSSEKLDQIVAAHQIDTEALRANDFYTFFDDRKRRLIKLVEGAMGKSVQLDEVDD